MTQKDDYQRLASQFVDMWQKNMALAMNDSEFIRAFLQMMQASSLSTRENSFYGNSATAQHTAGTAASPDARDHAVTGIKDSLAAIETRLSALERAIAGHVSAPHPEPAKGVARSAKRPTAGGSGGKRSGKKNG